MQWITSSPYKCSSLQGDTMVCRFGNTSSKYCGMCFAKYVWENPAFQSLFQTSPHCCWYQPIRSDLALPKSNDPALDRDKTAFAKMLQSAPWDWDYSLEDYLNRNGAHERWMRLYCMAMAWQVTLFIIHFQLNVSRFRILRSTGNGKVSLPSTACVYKRCAAR